MGSLCIQRMIVDFVNMVFVGLFYSCLLIDCVRKWPHPNSGGSRKDWVFVLVSVCCALVGIAYLGVGFWDVVNETGEFNHLKWLVYLGRALVWISSSVSLLVRKSTWVRNLVTVWWVCFPLSASAINIETLARTHSIPIVDIVAWPVNFFLLVCAFTNFCAVDSPESSNLSEPLLGEKNENNCSRIGQAGFLSKLTFCWINPLLSLGYVKPLSLEDIPSLVPGDEANVLYQKFALEFDFSARKKSTDNTGNLVLQTVVKLHFKENIIVAVHAFLKLVATVGSPLFIYAFVNYSNLEEQNLQQGFYIVGGLVIIKTVESLCQRHWYFRARRSGMRIRSTLMVAIYQKQLKLSNVGRRRHSTGEIVNYIAVDAYRMGEFPWWFHTAWSLILQLLLSVIALLVIVGLGALIGLVPLFIFGVLNLPFAKMMQKCQSKLMVAQDERLRATSEILNSMKIIKLQSWEEKFKSLIESRRHEQFQWLTAMQIRKAFSSLLYWMSPTIVSAVIFLVCAFLKSAPLNASTIFTVLAILRNMGEPVRMTPEALSFIIQGKVSFDRINSFLLDDELKIDNVGKKSYQNGEERVTIQGGSFTWEPELLLPTIRDVDLDIKCGQKIAICGPVGAGKSSLLYAILGEMPKISGSVSISGSISYVSQTSWIQSGTIRDNILYGKPMEQGRYDMAIRACALDKDIDSFRHGDLTEIGQRGLNMSGGQKQRLQLARAVYNDADIYLLDDPFSAVDAHTAAVLFRECVMNAPEKKTLILVTHQVEFLSAVDRILVVKSGKIIESGNYEELLMAGTTFEHLVNAHKDAISVLGPANSVNLRESETGDMVQPEETYLSYPVIEQMEDDIPVKGETGIQLTEEEEKEIGDVGWKPFWDYLNVLNGTPLFILCILLSSVFVTFSAASTYWLAFGIQIPEISNGALIGVYTLISVLSAVFVFGRSFVGAHLGLRASKGFFCKFTDSIFRAPMLFFDSTPVGRILARASSDLSVIDFDIPFSIIFVVSSTIELVAIIGIMVSVTWQVLIVAIFAMAATKYVQGYYLTSARELLRINGTTKAPVMNYASETSLGVITIRAFEMADRFFQNFVKLVDQDAVLFFHSNGAMEWLLIRVEALQNVTLFAAALLIALLPKGYISPGMVGLSLSYALSLSLTQVFLTRWYCNLSNHLVSVERIVQFMCIPPEPPAVVEDKRPPSSWPPSGRIELQDLKIRYRQNASLVLKGIDCTFKEGTRVGVVGRTGSGKSTLISALFRVVEPESGKILIDGLDICSIGLKDLRTKLSIIPQEPTLFKGSVRTNLDPLGLYSDDELWEALDKCQLKATIGSLPNLLESSVSDDGENWSTGQRQLLCLGRVLLKRNKILVLDEATASIDSTTDAILQRIIRQEFSECTVITVAHRVPTVVDSDMVMVLSYGKLVEYDEPSKLMDTNSYFSKLVAEYWSSCTKNSLLEVKDPYLLFYLVWTCEYFLAKISI